MTNTFEQQPRESTKAFAAFKIYLDLGPNRSLVVAAAKMGCSKRRMEWLSRKYDWPARVAARDAHVADLERQAIERLAVEKAVEWWQLHEPARRQAWLEAEEAIAMVREARERWRKSGRTPGFEGMARMLDLAFKLKQFAAGMPSEIKEVHNLHAGKVSVEWEEAIRKAYQVEVLPDGHQANQPAPKGETIVDAEVVS
ncbi:MAG: hypothetical protein P4N60_11570 [Verrucomicrobiae bacterium]|nr:hypothetical protein [Verrucomicrobiae bacterium]